MWKDHDDPYRIDPKEKATRRELYEKHLGRKLTEEESIGLEFQHTRLTINEIVPHQITVDVRRDCEVPFIENGALVTPRGYDYTLFGALDLEPALKARRCEWKLGSQGVVIGRDWYLSDHEIIHNEIHQRILRNGSLQLWYQLLIGGDDAGKFWARYDWIKPFDEK